jgi:hypothetical protein
LIVVIKILLLIGLLNISSFTAFANTEKKLQGCISDVAQDTRIYVELAVVKQLREQGKQLATENDAPSELIFKNIEKIIKSSVGAGKIVAADCSQKKDFLIIQLK